MEPDVVALHFCAGLINFFAKDDMQGAIRDFTAFVRAAKEETAQVTEARALLAEAQCRLDEDKELRPLSRAS